MGQSERLSIVIPVFNEEGNIEAMYRALLETLEPMGIAFEIIFADDGSRDRSYEQIEQLSSTDPRVKGLSFSRNFGHQIALFAGLNHASGDLIISMDGDLQHPPSLIPKLIETYRKGYDIVNTKRIDTKETGWFKRKTSSLFYRIINRLSDIEIEPGSADFRLMSQKTVEAYLSIPEKDRFTRGLISWMGFRQAVVPYEVQPRLHGQSKYTLKKMIRFALNGITSFSSKPLRLSFYLGLYIAMGAILYGVYATFQFARGEVVPGWTSILLSVLFIGGVILINLGILGEYLARVFNETKNRPLYFIRSTTGFDDDPENEV